MKKTIWKFELETRDDQEIKMPIGAQVLTVQMQFGTPCLWALVDPNKEKETRTFEVVGTGHEIDYSLTTRGYIGTYQLAQGQLIFHVFERFNK